MHDNKPYVLALESKSKTKEAGNNTEIFHVGKRAGKCSVPQAETNALILKLAKEGKNVVRLKGGDPFVFSRGGEEVSILEKNGISVEIVPGITSGIAAPTYFGIPPVSYTHLTLPTNLSV